MELTVKQSFEFQTRNSAILLPNKNVSHKNHNPVLSIQNSSDGGVRSVRPRIDNLKLRCQVSIYLFSNYKTGNSHLGYHARRADLVHVVLDVDEISSAGEDGRQQVVELVRAHAPAWDLLHLH